MPVDDGPSARVEPGAAARSDELPASFWRKAAQP